MSVNLDYNPYKGYSTCDDKKEKRRNIEEAIRHYSRWRTHLEYAAKKVEELQHALKEGINDSYNKD